MRIIKYRIKTWVKGGLVFSRANYQCSFSCLTPLAKQCVKNESTKTRTTIARLSVQNESTPKLEHNTIIHALLTLSTVT